MAFLKYAFQKRLHLLRLDQILTRKLLFIERVPLDARQEHGEDVGRGLEINVQDQNKFSILLCTCLVKTLTLPL